MPKFSKIRVSCKPTHTITYVNAVPDPIKPTCRMLICCNSITTSLCHGAHSLPRHPGPLEGCPSTKPLPARLNTHSDDGTAVTDQAGYAHSRWASRNCLPLPVGTGVSRVLFEVSAPCSQNSPDGHILKARYKTILIQIAM